MASIPDEERCQSTQKAKSVSEDHGRGVARRPRRRLSQDGHDTTQAETDSDSTSATSSKSDRPCVADLKLAHRSRLHSKRRRRSEDSAVSTEAKTPYRSPDGLRHTKRRRSVSAPIKAPEDGEKSNTDTQVDNPEAGDERIDSQNGVPTTTVNASDNDQHLKLGEISHEKRAEVVDWLTVIDDDLYTPAAGTTSGLQKDHPRVLREVFDELAHNQSSSESSEDEHPTTMFGYFL